VGVSSKDHLVVICISTLIGNLEGADKNHYSKALYSGSARIGLEKEGKHECHQSAVMGGTFNYLVSAKQEGILLA
jgi:hypothetical protein